MSKYTDSFLLSELVRYYNENNKSPRQCDIHTKFGYPPISAYYDNFGSFSIALEKAGLKVNKCGKYSKKELISILQSFYNKYGYSPSKKDINDMENAPSAETFVSYFGTWNNALKAANLEEHPKKEFSKEYLINDFKRACNELDRLPTMNDLCVKNGYVDKATYYKHFHSYENLLEACGYSLEYINNIKREELTQELQSIYIKIGRAPFQKELLAKNGYNCANVYVHYFGSLTNAFKAAGLPLNKEIHTYDGTETCTICKCKNTTEWRYIDNNIVCLSCYFKDLRKNSSDNFRTSDIISKSKHREFGFVPLNHYFENSHAHHLHLENTSDFSIYIPGFLHQMHWHSHNKPDTMVTINALALDYWVNESLYKELYFE